MIERYRQVAARGAALMVLLGLASSPVLAHEGHRHPAPEATAPAAEAAFLAGNKASMDRMMDAMAVRPTGDVDRDFVAMMAPHHQGAIDMATTYLRYGRNEQLRRMAQEIIVTQQQEIAAMRLALGEVPPPSAPASAR